VKEDGGLILSSYYQRGIDSKGEGSLHYTINILKYTINQRLTINGQRYGYFFIDSDS
jgi:hypothetical protein